MQDDHINSFLTNNRDLKSLKKLNTFVGSHGDDVMKLSFHSKKYNMLLSGSIDGCVCLYDLKQGNEDDALETGMESAEFFFAYN